MSESVTAIFSIGWLSGVITAIVAIGLIRDERRNKGQSIHDSSDNDGVLPGNRTRGGTNGCDKGLGKRKGE